MDWFVYERYIRHERVKHMSKLKIQFKRFHLFRYSKASKIETIESLNETVHDLGFLWSKPMPIRIKTVSEL